MKLALTTAAALTSLSIVGPAGATPSLSYVAQPINIAAAEFVEAKVKF